MNFLELLNEISGEEIYKKYYSKIPFRVFLRIISADPQTKINDGKIQKIGKHSKLLVSLYQKGNLLLEDLVKAKEYLTYVYTYNVPLQNINQLGDIYELIKTYIVKENKTLNDVLKVLNENEYKVLHNGENWLIFQPLNEKAACYLGVNTQWCTSWGKHSLNKDYKDRINRFVDYSDDVLYIIINKNSENDKYQFSFKYNQFMDVNDKQIHTKEFIKENPELLYYFFPSLIRETTVEEKNLEKLRFRILPPDYLDDYFKKINVGGLVGALINGDESFLKSVFENEFIIEDDKITFSLSDLSYTLQNVNTKILNNISDIEEPPYRDLYDEVEIFLEQKETQDENIKFFLKEYYNENKNNFIDDYNITTFKEFEETFYDNYLDFIFVDFIKDSTMLTIPNLLKMIDEELKNITQLINIQPNDYGSDDVTVDMFELSKIIFSKNTEQVKIEEDELLTILDEYVDFFDLNVDNYRDYEIVFPTYNGIGNSTKKTIEYFEEKLENVGDELECKKLRTKLNDIISKYFKYDNTFENDEFSVTLKSKKINCDKGTVHIMYHNKNTKKTFGSSNKNDEVKIDNLVTMLTNYKLFESIIGFKKLI